jgi:hypothetical protein|nr:MAG TPA: hypothetical protein [Crassvirales sp.]
MQLIRVENFEVKASDEILLYPSFKKLYKSDRTKDKSNFFKFLSILYFTYDIRSNYQYIIDEKERLKVVCESNGYDIPKFSDLELECIKLYKNSQNTTASMLLQDTRATIDKIRTMLREIEINDLEEKDKVTAIKTIAATVNMIPKLAKDLTEAEKAVSKEIEESGRARGNQGSKTLMDDGIL